MSEAPKMSVMICYFFKIFHYFHVAIKHLNIETQIRKDELNLRISSASVALPIISWRHLGQLRTFGFDLKMAKVNQGDFQGSICFDTASLETLTYLQVSQRRCPFLHWKILVGGAISSRHTWVINTMIAKPRTA